MSGIQIPVALLDPGMGPIDFAPISGDHYLKKTEREARDLFRDAVDSIKTIRSRYLVSLSCSFGKDSTTVLLAGLLAHRELIDEGVIAPDAPFIITAIDTMVENHLMQMLVLNEVDRLMQYASDFNLNIDIRIGTPPLAKQWAALFLSGIKIISSARTNNDCSVMMKVDNAEVIERQVAEQYGNSICTLLGTRFGESAKRDSSVRRHNMDNLTADDLVERDGTGSLVFAPIVNMTDDHVWTLLRQAGINPIQQSSLGLPPIPSYAENHRLLHVIYSDSKSGSCPTSAKRLKGEKQSLGGCGGSARTGCYLCAKSVTDKSGEAQAHEVRHAVISGNILNVRNYIMSVAQDIDYRTWHSRAVDATTGAIALQPNVLNAPTLEKVIWLLSQATWDDKARADQFSALVAAGREMEDPGYADIINDTSLDKEDRFALADVYKRYAVRHLIKPMSLELSVFLSAIHSRDGIRLPPYRALYIWFATKNGERIPYPNVDPEKAKVDEIPDSVMVLPSRHDISMFTPSTGDGLFDTESMDGCDGLSSEVSSNIPVWQAKYFLPEHEHPSLAGLRLTDTVNIRGLETANLTHKMRYQPTTHAPKPQFSKRSIKKISRKDGRYSVVERGRTSLNSYSFSERTSEPHLCSRLQSPVLVGMPSARRDYNPLLEAMDESISGYAVDHNALLDWIDYGGMERAFEKHDEAVSIHRKWDDNIYYYGGLSPLEDFLRYGVLKLNRQAASNAARIMTRTAYYNSLNLLAINDEAVKKIALNETQSRDIGEFRKNIKVDAALHISQVLSMKMYRAYKADYLWHQVRLERNSRRKSVRFDYALLLNDPASFVLNQLEQLFSEHHSQYKASVVNEVLSKTLFDQNIKYFDGQDFYAIHHTNRGFTRLFRAIFADFQVMMQIFDPWVKRSINSNLVSRKRVIDAGARFCTMLDNLKSEALSEVLSALNDKSGRSMMYYLLFSKPELTRHAIDDVTHRLSGAVELSLDDVFRSTFRLGDSVVSAQGFCF